MTKHHVFHSMGIPIHLTLVGVSESESQNALKKVTEVFNEYDLRFSRFKPESELMGLNTSSGAWHKVSVELFSVLKKCVTLAAETDGAFDPSVGGVLASFGYGLPENFTLREPIATYRDLAFNDRELLIRLAPGQILEPACVVKGLAIDVAGKALKEILNFNTQGFMINAGGDIFTAGSFENSKPWNIVVQSPENRDSIITAVSLQNAGMATSGTYQTTGEHNGTTWQHLVNMRTQKASPDIVSATVIAETCEQADTEASLAILLAKGEALKRLESKKLPYLLVTNSGEVLKNTFFSTLEIPIESLIQK